MHAFCFLFLFFSSVVFRMAWRKLARRVAACISFTREKKNMKQIALEESLRLWQGASDMFFA